MSAKASKPNHAQHIQHERFTTKCHGYQLWHVSVDLSGNIVVSGFHKSGRTYIDLYSRTNSDYRDKLKLFYSKEFETYLDYSPKRFVSFLDKNVSKLVTCIGDKIEIIDTKNESKVLRLCRVNGMIWCLAVRDGEIFICLEHSQTVLVFNNDLKETRKITIKGNQDGDYPYVLQPIKDTLFVCTWLLGRVFSLSVYDGSTVSEYTYATKMNSAADSIAVSEEMNLVAVLWHEHPISKRIVVYSLNQSNLLLVFDVDNDVSIIRISDRDRMIITGNENQGEIKMHDLEQLFSFEGMKRSLADLVSRDECEKLRKYFGVTEEEMEKLEVDDDGNSDENEMQDEDMSEDESDDEEEKTLVRMECLLTIIEKKGQLNPYNINTLTDAVSALGDESRISYLKGPMEGYFLHGKNTKIIMAEMVTSQKALEDDRNQLGNKLEAAESKVKEHKKTLKDLQRQLTSVTEQSQQQKKKLREDFQNAEPKVKELEEKGMTLSEKLEESKKSIDLNEASVISLTEELAQARSKPAKEMDMLSEQLKPTKDKMSASRTKYTKEIERPTEQPGETTEIVNLSRTESSRKIETLTNEHDQTKQLSDFTTREDTNEITTLRAELNDTKQKLVIVFEELGTANRDLEMTKKALKETTQDRDITRAELTQYQLDFAKESNALKEVLNQAKETMAVLHKRSLEDKSVADSEETNDAGDAVLTAEFGRLTVAIAEHLTLDDCLKLAKICNIPASDCDTVLRVSMIESPGMRILGVLKKRKVINMFDVTNLQKALKMLHLEAVNHDLVLPYQEKIDKEQYELYKVEEMYTWAEVDAFVSVKHDTAQHQIRDSQVSLIVDSEPEYTSQTEATPQPPDAGVKGRGLPRDKLHHQLYTEQSIGRDGGTIYIANVSLKVPPDALHVSHVIALSVMNESPFPLDREVDTARMTPLIKLEPLGLTFEKPLQLNIPHSALISKPENHDVIIYSGQIARNNEDSSDSIRWTEEKSVTKQLKDKSVTVDIYRLTYLSASLVSQTSAPPLYIVRAVPFIDGVRNTDDDLIVTICFCSDNDTEYNMLLSDYHTKLSLEQYSTLQLHRHPERDEDDARFLSVIVSSVNNTFVPDKDQTVKKFAVSHLCTASRVSHQLRLKKNQDTDRDIVHIMLKFSQAQYEPTQIFLKARIKDLIISEESEKNLIGFVSPGSKTFEDMVINISSSLDTEQCRELASYFQLTSEDTEMITFNQDPGKILMNTLVQKSLIDSQKMIHFFEGLKACHLHETAKLVSEYISEMPKYDKEERKSEGDKKSEETDESTLPYYLLKKNQSTVRSSLNDQSVQATLSTSCVSSDIHVKTLTKEGYTEQEVVEALAFAKNRLVMARKVLQLRGEQFYAPSSKDHNYLHKEQYIDKNGGDIHLPEANVNLLIPAGAVSAGSIVSLTVITCQQSNVLFEGITPQLSSVIKVGPEGSKLDKDVILKIPHCASETDGIISTDIILGSSKDGEKIQWRRRKQHEPAPYLKKNHFEVHLQSFCVISLNIAVDYKKTLGKRLRVLPLIARVKNPSDDLNVTLWIYNDDETEHMHLLHEEVNVRGKIQLHDFKQYTLKGSKTEREVHIKSRNSKITFHANANVKKVLSATLWHNTRHAVEFHLQNKEPIADISFKLKLCTRQVLRNVVGLQFDVKVMLSELLQKPRGSIRALPQIQEPQPAMEKSFQELVGKLSGQLDMDSCLEIAGIFKLSSDLKDRVKKGREPGKVIFDELIQEQLITAASVSALDVALTRCGEVVLAEDVKEYRRRNATFPTTVYTLL